jgi:cyclopropane fatty-acyl-phospholipid synthase-like methyltransferase
MHRVDIDAFEEKYRANGDPWDFATSPYEQRRYDLIMAMLPRARYRRCFEPGASIGELTRRLATRCDEVVAVEASATAADQAEQLLRDKHPAVSVVRATIPEWWPTGRFDLVVLSEFGYYFDKDALRVLVERAADLLDADGTLVAAHWRGHSVDHLLHGDDVHELARDVLRGRLGRPSCVYTEADVRIDVWGTA